MISNVLIYHFSCLLALSFKWPMLRFWSQCWKDFKSRWHSTGRHKQSQMGIWHPNAQAHGSEFIRLFIQPCDLAYYLGSEIRQTWTKENWTVAIKKNLSSFPGPWKSVITHRLFNHCSLCLECFSPEFLIHNPSINSNVNIFKRSSLTTPPHYSLFYFLHTISHSQEIPSVLIYGCLFIISPSLTTRIQVLWGKVPLSILLISVSPVLWRVTGKE